jgi:hypothetical protein
MSAPAIPQGDLQARLVAVARDAEKPLSFSSLAKLARVKKTETELLRAALDSAVAAGQVHRWPDRGKSQYFWHLAAERAAREALVTAAATEALSKALLSKLTAKKLFGFPVKRMASLVSALIAEKQLQALPGFAGKSELVVRPGDQEVYFNAARSYVAEKIRLAGFEPAAFFKETSPVHEKPAGAKVDAAALVLEAVQWLEPVKGVPVSTLRLRNHLASLSKHELDAAALELRKKQLVFLSEHVDPYNISREDKDLLIDGRDGTFYVAIAIR